MPCLSTPSEATVAALGSTPTMVLRSGMTAKTLRSWYPFAKAYSGLTDAEIKKVDQVIRKTIEDKFGPVRQVRPSLVMELGFEAVMESSRHKSGIAVRFPRILRLRPDKTIEQADRLSSLQAMLS